MVTLLHAVIVGTVIAVAVTDVGTASASSTGVAHPTRIESIDHNRSRESTPRSSLFFLPKTGFTEPTCALCIDLYEEWFDAQQDTLAFAMWGLLGSATTGHCTSEHMVCAICPDPSHRETAIDDVGGDLADHSANNTPDCDAFDSVLGHVDLVQLWFEYHECGGWFACNLSEGAMGRHRDLIVSLIEKSDVQAIRMHLADPDSPLFFNESRQAIQAYGCTGSSIALHLPISDELATALQIPIVAR